MAKALVLHLAREEFNEAENLADLRMQQNMHAAAPAVCGAGPAIIGPSSAHNMVCTAGRFQQNLALRLS